MLAAKTLDELILEQTAEAVIFANREGVIERWNAAAVAMFGFAAEEALGQSLDLMIPEHLRKAHWRGFDAAMASGKTRLGGRPKTATSTRCSSIRRSWRCCGRRHRVGPAGSRCGCRPSRRGSTARPCGSRRWCTRGRCSDC